MATNYQKLATQQVSPVYAQQQQAIEAQIPSITNLYSTLAQGLQAQNAAQLETGVQEIVNDANARGVLRSTIPNDARAMLTSQLGAALTQSLGQLNSQQAQDIAGIRTQVGQLNIDRLRTIQDVAGSLQQRDMQERDYALRAKQAERDYQLRIQEIAASRAAAAADDSDPTSTFTKAFATWMKGQKKMPSRQAQDKYINSLFERYGISDKTARQVVWNAVNSEFKRSSDPTKDWTWKR